jgi:kynurenine 3-monooxygenase
MARYKDHYVSKHILVMFTNTPYAQAMAHGELQTKLLDKICSSIDKFQEVQWHEVDALMKEYDKKLAKC